MLFVEINVCVTGNPCADVCVSVGSWIAAKIYIDCFITIFASKQTISLVHFHPNKRRASNSITCLKCLAQLSYGPSNGTRHTIN